MRKLISQKFFAVAVVVKLVVFAAFLAFFAMPAHADNFSVSYSTGGKHWNNAPHWNDRGHGYGRGHGHGWGHRPYYRPRNNVVLFNYYTPPPIVQTTYVVQPQNITLGQQVAYNDGGYCREYQGLVTIGGVKQSSYGTACLQPDGSWRIAE